MAANVLNTVTNLVTNVLSTTAKVTHLGELPGLTGRIPIEVLLVGHCLAVASITKGRFGGKLLNFVQGFLMAFGGSVASNLFLGNPTSNVLFQNNQVVLIWAASWWLINHQPLDVINNLFDLQPVGIFARVCVQVLRAGLIAAQVDAAAKAFPGIIAPAIIAGTLAGSGGKITTDIISSVAGHRSPFELSAPTYVLRSALVGSSIYYLTVHFLRALTGAEGLGLVLVAFLTHTLTDDLLGSAYDYTGPVIDVFTTVTLITLPAAGARQPRAAAAAKPSTPRSTSRGRTPRRTRKSD